MRFLRLLLCLVLLVRVHAADAASDAPAAALNRLASAQPAERQAGIEALATSHDARWVRFLEDYRQGAAYVWQDRVVLIPDVRAGQGVPIDPVTRVALGPAMPVKGLTEVPVARKERAAAGEAITRLRLFDPDPAARLNAVIKAGDAGGAVNRLALADLVTVETVAHIARNAHEGIAIIDLDLGDDAAKAAAAVMLADAHSTRALSKLRVLASANSTAATVKKAAVAAVSDLESYQSRIRITQTIFSGLSAGSILIVMALGLSITFGLMGVINMAHGEMLMIGAYATLLVQWGFAHLPPAFMPYYFPIGVVAGFCASACVGWLLELTVIRHLYGRPLETLLATWGVSYLLIQTIRVIFGDNQAVTAPGWLVGGWEPLPDLVLPYNRLFIIGLTVVSIVAVMLLIGRTRLGLLLRATTQSRRTAASLGVNTRMIDGMTFALGSGLAGAAGCALTLIGGLKPDMGQEFIIDSFLVVATGGVGSLTGVVWAGAGLGILNKVLEPFTQAVFAKVIVLGVVIFFLQYRPQGIFAPKGRLADN